MKQALEIMLVEAERLYTFDTEIYNENDFPTKKLVPIIYFLYNLLGECIYVGKTTRPKERMNAHFKGVHKSEVFYKEIDSVKYLKVEDELDLPLFEGLYIKLLLPKYNEEILGRKIRSDASIDKQTVIEIKECFVNGMYCEEIANQFNITKTLVYNIGKEYTHQNVFVEGFSPDIVKHGTKIPDETVIAVYKECMEGILTFVQIAKKYNVSEGTVSTIKNKKTHKEITDKIKVVEKPNISRKGENQNHAILTEKQVIEIYKTAHSGTMSMPRIAKKYGVSRDTIFDIKNGRSWKHLTKDIECEKIVRVKLLTEQEVIEIYKDLKNNLKSIHELAKEYGVENYSISRIKRKTSWKSLTDEIDKQLEREGKESWDKRK